MTLGLILLQLKNTNPHIPRTVPSMIKSQTEMEKKIYEIKEIYSFNTTEEKVQTDPQEDVLGKCFYFLLFRSYGKYDIVLISLIYRVNNRAEHYLSRITWFSFLVNIVMTEHLLCSYNKQEHTE